MRQIYLTLILLLLSSLGYAQRKYPLPPPAPPTKAELQREALHDRCLHTDRYTAKQRRALFPFSGASSIKLISFEWLGPNAPIYDTDGKLISGDSPDTDTVDLITAVAPNKYVINYRKVKEQTVININAMDRLTDILYNYGRTPVPNLSSPEVADIGTKCYEPRNAVLFIDASGNVVQYIEICFSCRRYYFSSSRTKSFEYCSEKFDMLRKFFRKQGILYGTAKDFKNY